jgi:hypothetical protein
MGRDERWGRQQDEAKNALRRAKRLLQTQKASYDLLRETRGRVKVKAVRIGHETDRRLDASRQEPLTCAQTLWARLSRKA